MKNKGLKIGGSVIFILAIVCFAFTMLFSISGLVDFFQNERFASVICWIFNVLFAIPTVVLGIMNGSIFLIDMKKSNSKYAKILFIINLVMIILTIILTILLVCLLVATNPN